MFIMQFLIKAIDFLRRKNDLYYRRYPRPSRKFIGDFGFVFHNNQKELDFLNKLAALPYQICFIDGNHKNFDYLNQLPITI